jgi:tetratricopeptide (TPR) repeat protein
VPVIGLVQVGDQSMADRYTYLPLIGLFIALVWGLSDLFESSRVRRIFTISLACTVLFALMVITRSQVRRWQNTQTLFEYALLVTENNYLAHLALAQAARLNGDLDRDTFHTKKAVEINPAYVAKIHNRCGYALAEEGNLGEAISEFEEALQIVPAYANAHNNLGVVLARKARYDEALEHFAAALEITPGDTKIMESRRNVEAERERVRASKAADF